MCDSLPIILNIVSQNMGRYNNNTKPYAATTYYFQNRIQFKYDTNYQLISKNK